MALILALSVQLWGLLIHTAGLAHDTLMQHAPPIKNPTCGLVPSTLHTSSVQLNPVDAKRTLERLSLSEKGLRCLWCRLHPNTDWLRSRWENIPCLGPHLMFLWDLFQRVSCSTRLVYLQRSHNQNKHRGFRFGEVASVGEGLHHSNSAPRSFPFFWNKVTWAVCSKLWLKSEHEVFKMLKVPT